jgi:hypothetical protein
MKLPNKNENIKRKKCSILPKLPFANSIAIFDVEPVEADIDV